jgi:hypothetical protein
MKLAERLAPVRGCGTGAIALLDERRQYRATGSCLLQGLLYKLIG